VGIYLLIVSVMESAVGDSEESLELVVVAVFAVALEEGEGRQEVSLLHEVGRIGQLHLLSLRHKRGTGYWERGVYLQSAACSGRPGEP
jgi:hypothetical protein